MWNKKIEGLARPELENLQLARLQELVSRICERVPFYKKALQDAGVSASSIRALKDLEQVPFTKKSDLRDHYPTGLFSVPLSQLSRIHASSGTKGKPTVVGYTKNDIDIWSEVCARSLVAAGVRPG